MVIGESICTVTVVIIYMVKLGAGGSFIGVLGNKGLTPVNRDFENPSQNLQNMTDVPWLDIYFNDF